MARSYGVASVSRCPWRVRLYPNSDQNVAVPRLSAMCRLCCKSLFALLIKNSLGSRCDFGINMRGTSSHSDELTGDFGNKPEAILIGDHGLSCLLAEKLSLRDLRLLQQYLPGQRGKRPKLSIACSKSIPKAAASSGIWRTRSTATCCPRRRDSPH